MNSSCKECNQPVCISFVLGYMSLCFNSTLFLSTLSAMTLIVYIYWVYLSWDTHFAHFFCLGSQLPLNSSHTIYCLRELPQG